MDDTIYIKNHVQRYLSYYRWRGKLHAFAHYNVVGLTIIISALIPIFVVIFPNQNELPAASGAAISILSGLGALFKFRDRMISCKVATETIASELIKYSTECEPYDNTDKFKKFVLNVEKINNADLSEWKSLNTKEITTTGSASTK